jgi:hypothetical protein
MEFQFMKMMNRLNTAGLDTTVVDDMFVYIGDKCITVQSNTDKYEMSVFRIPDSMVERVQIRKRKADRFTPKETTYLRATGFTVDGEFATKSTI